MGNWFVIKRVLTFTGGDDKGTEPVRTVGCRSKEPCRVEDQYTDLRGRYYPDTWWRTEGRKKLEFASITGRKQHQKRDNDWLDISKSDIEKPWYGIAEDGHDTEQYLIAQELGPVLVEPSSTSSWIGPEYSS